MPGFDLGSIMSNAINFGEDLVSANEAQHRASDSAGRAENFSAAQVQQQEQFQKDMRATQYQTTVADLKAAGLNPALAYTQGGAGNLSGSSASGILAPTPQTRSGGPIDITTAAQIRNLDAQTAKTTAEKGEIEARTPTYAVSMDQMRAQIDSIRATIQKTIQDTKTSAASAAQSEQQTTNLKALLPQIEQTTRQIRAQTNLTTAQTGLTQKETDKLNQLLEQNLPKIEAALQNLKVAAAKMDQPRQENQAAAQSSYFGALGAYLEAINPLRGMIGTMK